MESGNKKNPFKTPEGYFEGFSDALKTRLSKKDKSFPKKDSFDIPEHYFKGLHTNILQKLEEKEPKVISLHPIKKRYYAIATIAALGLLHFVLNRNTSKKLTFDDIANSDIENYFENNDIDFSTYEIAEVVPVDELKIEDIVTNEINKYLIFNYIDENTQTLEELNIPYGE